MERLPCRVSPIFNFFIYRVFLKVCGALIFRSINWLWFDWGGFWVISCSTYFWVQLNYTTKLFYSLFTWHYQNLPTLISISILDIPREKNQFWMCINFLICSLFIIFVITICARIWLKIGRRDYFWPLFMNFDQNYFNLSKNWTRAIFVRDLIWAKFSMFIFFKKNVGIRLISN